MLRLMEELTRNFNRLPDLSDLDRRRLLSMLHTWQLYVSAYIFNSEIKRYDELIKKKADSLTSIDLSKRGNDY